MNKNLKLEDFKKVEATDNCEGCYFHDGDLDSECPASSEFSCLDEKNIFAVGYIFKLKVQED